MQTEYSYKIVNFRRGTKGLWSASVHFFHRSGYFFHDETTTVVHHDSCEALRSAVAKWANPLMEKWAAPVGTV